MQQPDEEEQSSSGIGRPYDAGHKPTVLEGDRKNEASQAFLMIWFFGGVCGVTVWAFFAWLLGLDAPNKSLVRLGYYWGGAGVVALTTAIGYYHLDFNNEKHLKALECLFHSLVSIVGSGLVFLLSFLCWKTTALVLSFPGPEILVFRPMIIGPYLIGCLAVFCLAYKRTLDHWRLNAKPRKVPW